MLVMPGEEEQLQVVVDNVDTIVAHNGIGFDVGVLERCWGVTIDPAKVADTLIMSRLWNPSLDGGHSLKAWGERLGFEKMDYDVEDFDAGFTSSMGEYCLRDCAVTARLYDRLGGFLKRDGFSDRSVILEHSIATLTQRQIERGLLLDVPAATELVTAQFARMNAIEAELQQVFPPIVTKRVHKRTGAPLSDDVQEFNVGSRVQIASRLEGLGVRWKQKTETGRAVVNENTLATIDLPEAKLILEYLTLQKRSGMVDSWLAAAGEDGRVHGRVNTCGAVTGRMTHSSPNLAQIPRGGEYRDVWTVPDGYSLVGVDAAQLELRLLAHYMKDQEYIDQILTGDIHSYNQEMAGLETRDQAKTFIYALIYGAGDSKIGQIVGGTAKDGKALKDKFFRKLPAFGRLKSRVGGIVEDHGVLPGLDGRRIRVRSAHSALNTLLQGAGAAVMKQATVQAYAEVQALELDACPVAQVHDEVQWEVVESQAVLTGEIMLKAIRGTTDELNLRCPMDGDVLIGKTWKETH
jgi:DNA polymerase I-like protein with 3'-5' exonuclease and polymerase domains